MSQQLLYDADIGAVVQQVGRKAVTKDVRMDPDVHAAAVTLPAHDILYAPCGQPLSPLIDKEDVVIFISDRLCAHLIDIALQTLADRRIKRNQTFLVALSKHTQPAGIHQFKHRPIPLSDRRLLIK